MYDLIIIGAGPAGLTASIYASRYKIKYLVIADRVGGLISESYRIENYPGFESISGKDLINKMTAQAKKLGTQIIQDEVGAIEKIKDGFSLKTKLGKNYQTKTLILAFGMRRRQLNIEGEEEFSGKGVSYCATCDAPLFRNKLVAVVGGGDSAATAALHLSEFAKKVYLIVREEKMKAEPSWQEEIKNNPKIEVILKTNVLKMTGGNLLSEIILDRPYLGKKSLKIAGLFIEIGFTPSTTLIKNLKVKLDQSGFIKIKEDSSTNLEGVYAAGDITTGSAKFQQIITACAEGAIAAFSCFLYLKGK